jgi:transposase-like protein
MAKLFQNKVFQDATAAREWLEGRLWPQGPVCGHCGAVDQAKALSNRPGTYQCNACRKQFTVTVGTVFERSHIPLNKWLMATFLFCASKKGVSAHQMHRLLDITHKSAWFMMHRLREAVMSAPGSEPPLGGPGQIVEADETELGKSPKSRSKGRKHNLKFVSLIERGGKVRSRKITGADKPISLDIHDALYRNVHVESALHTDGAKHYKYSLFRHSHEAVDHNKEFVRDGKAGRVHTNSAEGFFSIFKRGLVGTYHHMSDQHLHRYLAEFDFRQNTRAKLGIGDEVRAEMALKGIVGKRLTYRRTNQAGHA